ncbi:MAG TPA: TonB-dependent receptor [Candidatus Sulfotelmatobacter sp.]|nr:TonB-dependent receptor [Candidatus Sulfotelmatobacter sp.]
MKWARAQFLRRVSPVWLLLAATLVWNPLNAFGQTEKICGTVQDQSGAVVAGAVVQLSDPNTRLDVSTDDSGVFCISQLHSGSHELTVVAPGFSPRHQTVIVHAGEDSRTTISLSVEGASQQVTVIEGIADVSSLNVAQTQIGTGLIANLPSESVNAALSSILTLATPGVAADSNGVFHPLGEHAETSFSIDGQPISDQQSRIFSNQISANTIQEMRTLQGAPPAEFGDKTSLIVEATTRSGLNTGKARGTLSLGYGSFGTPTTSVALASGSGRWGNFFALDGVDSQRFLDAPEFQPLHANGNAETLFDRVDWRPSDATSLHLNLSTARSWFQVPNTYDQQAANQDQRQHMTSFNVGLGVSHFITPAVLVMANTWVRQDRVNYFPSANVYSDQPATLSQSRRLTSTGFRTDVTYARGRHTAKAGVQMQVTPLSESFNTGLTDPAFNSPCVEANGVPVPDPSLISPSQCVAAGYTANPSYQPALMPYDLARGGTLFHFRGGATIYEGSAYVQESIRLGQFNLSLGLRYDDYAGLSRGFGIQPRGGITYQVRSTGTVFHVSYARVFLTPYNENLVLSSSTGAGGLGAGSNTVQPLTPARRNQFNAGIEQQFGPKFGIQAEYFWKFTRGAYDFNTILNTPLNFPIQFRKSKIDGALVRATLTNVHGFSAFTVLGHSRSRLFSPEVGGINFATAYAPVARPDHDQGFQQTTNVQYQFSQRDLRGLWLGLTWRFDSGLVVVSVPDYAKALTLTGDEQHAMGLYCGGVFATVAQPLETCNSSNRGATLIHIVPDGTYNPDTNPSRIRPRNLFDIALGSEKIWTKDRYSLGAKVTVVNLADKVALYNFLSSFSGTHFVTPRTLQGEIALHF